MGFKIEGIIFMSVVWITVISIAIFCFRRVLMIEKAKRNKMDAMPNDDSSVYDKKES